MYKYKCAVLLLMEAQLWCKSLQKAGSDALTLPRQGDPLAVQPALTRF